MTVSVSSQMMLFLLSMGIGGAFGLVYDVLYLGRLLSPCGRVLSFLWDCLYLLACGLVTFLFLLAGNAGEVRFFLLEGELLGFLFYRFTLGVPVSKAMRWFAARTRSAAAETGRRLKRPVVCAGRRFGRFVSQKYGQMKKRPPKDRKVVKRCLKPVRKVMYNLFHRTHDKTAGSSAPEKEHFGGADR